MLRIEETEDRGVFCGAQNRVKVLAAASSILCYGAGERCVTRVNR